MKNCILILSLLTLSCRAADQNKVTTVVYSPLIQTCTCTHDASTEFRRIVTESKLSASEVIDGVMRTAEEKELSLEEVMSLYGTMMAKHGGMVIKLVHIEKALQHIFQKDVITADDFSIVKQNVLKQPKEFIVTPTPPSE